MDTSMTMAATSTMDGGMGGMQTSMTMPTSSAVNDYSSMGESSCMSSAVTGTPDATSTAKNTYSTPAYGSGSYGGGGGGSGYQSCMQSEFVRFSQRQHANTSIQCVLHLMALLQWHPLRGLLLPPRLLQRVVLVAHTPSLLLLRRAFCDMCLSPSMHLLVTPSHLSGMPTSTLSRSHLNWR